MPPSLPLDPDPQPQSPAVPVSVISTIFRKLESTLNPGNIAQPCSLVDLPVSFILWGLCGGVVSSSPVPTPRPLAGGWDGRRPSLTEDGQELLHRGAPYPPPTRCPVRCGLLSAHRENTVIWYEKKKQKTSEFCRQRPRPRHLPYRQAL